MKRLLPLALATCLSMAASAQTAVLPYQPGVTLGGITYFLPKTAFRFVVKATCTTRHAGPYAEHAQRFLGITDAVTTDTDYWTIDSIYAVTYGVPDDSQAYTIALNPKTAAPLVTLTPEGVLLAINDQVEYEAPLPEGEAHEIPVVNPDASEFFSEDYLRAGSIVKKAETAATEIYDIREKRALIANGEADFNPTDGQQLQLMLERQDAREAALRTLFTGTISKKTQSIVIDYTPKAAVDQEVLFRFSSHLGFVDNDDLSGEPYYITVRDESTKVEADPTLEISPKKEMSHVRYRIPGHARIILSNSKQKVFEQNYFVAQFGYVEHLVGELFNKKFTTKIKFNPITGNIKNIDMAAPTK